MELYLKNWYRRFLDELPQTSHLRIISPFVKEQVLRKVHSQFDFNNFELITRFSLSDFAVGVSSLSGLKFSVKHGATIYGVKGLHSKVYLFDKRAAIITSANLTTGGLMNNYECGIFTTDSAVIDGLHVYFNQLKKIASNKLSIPECEAWESKLTGISVLIGAAGRLPDFGGSGITFDRTKNYYVKFFGTADNRVQLSHSVVQEIHTALCHYACGFPEKKRPRQVNDGDIVFMARMTEDPYDYAIFGKATALKFTDGRDVASDQEKAERAWKERWPIYLRVKDPVFINGTMADGVLLSDLMKKFDYESFHSTSLRHISGAPDIKLSNVLRQKAYIKLTLNSAEWLNQRFDEALENVGQVSDTYIKSLPQTTTDVSAWM